ncbi:MAG: hypothetical protein F9K40_10000 [Kofleriaceae bacterium]|nr:MAG: hypothetical protein F9K40_10000 [Kofleriaceae bacterium]MBZ0238854.1 hypothetical protein [Kofleriaceae bacterium]
MGRQSGYATTDDRDDGYEGTGGSPGKATLTARIPAVQRKAAAPEQGPEDRPEEEAEEEAEADDEPDDPFALHLVKPVQLKADTAAAAKPARKPKKKSKKQRRKGKYDRDADGKDSLGNLTESARGNQTSHDLENVFSGELEVLKNAQVYDARARKVKGRKVPAGTRVRFHKVGNSQARFSALDGSVAESDDLWLKCTAVGGRGSDVALGNSDEEDQARAAQILSTLPPGRTPGHSPHKWSFRSKFHPSVAGVALDSGLMDKIHRLIEWAIYNDMVTDNIEFSWGVRSPKDAHKFNVAYEIRNGGVSLAELQALPGGKDADGNLWYRPGDTLETVQAWMVERGLGNNPAASGYPRGDARRKPAIRGKLGISDHCSGHAVDVHIPWRARDGEGADVWAWEEIYHQFGLTRPLHRDRGGGRKPESWHIEQTGKELGAADDLGLDIDMGVFDGLIDL